MTFWERIKERKPKVGEIEEGDWNLKGKFWNFGHNFMRDYRCRSNVMYGTRPTCLSDERVLGVKIMCRVGCHVCKL